MANRYTMRISRLTVDKLGVKLYDRVSAVIAELIANAYDADASEVTIEAPMGTFLASKAGGAITDKGLRITVTDNGIGMTPQQVQDFFLVVGGERRNDPNRGGDNPTAKYGRKVMGRKGVGKLAPFGICKTIEVISSGGEFVRDHENGEEGYRTAHIRMHYDGIVSDELGEDYPPDVGELDGALRPSSGTQIVLCDFGYRLVPGMEDLARQIAQRFGIRSEHWQITLVDSQKSDGESGYSTIVDRFAVDIMPNTRISFTPHGTLPTNAIGPDGNEVQGLTAGFTHADEFFPVHGWIAYSKTPYRDDLMAGVRIYCRQKFAAQTAVFNRKAGFTGEHDVRSYVVGELQADWLDEREDLILTDRRDILWSDEVCSEFERWGQDVIRRIGVLSRDPMRRAKWDLFRETGQVLARAEAAFPSENVADIRARAVDLAKMFGRTISRAEAENSDVVDELVDMSLTLAPHLKLTEMMREAAAEADTPLSALVRLMRAARIAELASFGRIAEDRIKVVERLLELTRNSLTPEGDLQDLIEGAQWLINPEWVAVTANQSLASLKRAFERYYEQETGNSISLASFEDSGKRPDFVLSSQEGVIQIIEIKRPKHILQNAELERIANYHDNMDSFIEDPANQELAKVYRDFHITIVCDNVDALGRVERNALNGWLEGGRATLMSWDVFLDRTSSVHEDFLREAKRLQAIIGTGKGSAAC